MVDSCCPVWCFQGLGPCRWLQAQTGSARILRRQPDRRRCRRAMREGDLALEMHPHFFRSASVQLTMAVIGAESAGEETLGAELMGSMIRKRRPSAVAS